jgi:tetratricopeptide (TPR) repeat protein
VGPRLPALAGRAALALALLAAPGAARAQGYGGGAEVQGGAGQAAEKQEEKKEPERRWGKREKKKWGKQQTVRERTGKRLNATMEHIQAERYDEAEAELKKIRVQGLNGFERAKYHQIFALIANGRRDPAAARKHLELALAEEAFEPEEQAQLRYQIAGLLLGESKWAEAVDHLKQWFAATEAPTPTAYYLLALAYYQMEDLDAALEPAEKAVALGDPPQEGALQLLLAIRLTRQQYAEALPIMLQLVQRYPKKIYWVQMSTLYGAQGDYEKALVFLQLANRQGMLTEDEEVRRLAQLMLARDLPHPAALLLEQAFAEKRIREDTNSFELLSTAWIQARDFDKALAPLARAAELATDGKLSIRLAQVHLQREEWAEAEAAVRRAIEKGGLPSPGDAQILMGIVFFSEKRPQEALDWFARAREHKETREEAEIWIAHIQQQLPTVAAASASESTP